MRRSSCALVKVHARDIATVGLLHAPLTDRARAWHREWDHRALPEALASTSSSSAFFGTSHWSQSRVPREILSAVRDRRARGAEPDRSRVFWRGLGKCFECAEDLAEQLIVAFNLLGDLKELLA
jgi:hypothetical protein